MGDSEQLATALISQVKSLPQSLMVIAGDRGSGKTRLAKMLTDKGLGTYINFSMALARHLVTMSPSDNREWLDDFLANLLVPTGSEKPFIMGNIEAAFYPELRLEPLSLFVRIARESPLVVVWPGPVSAGEFIYSTADRLDYFHQRDSSVVVVNLGL